jgi:hypothetical protein
MTGVLTPLRRQSRCDMHALRGQENARPHVAICDDFDTNDEN